MCSRSLQVVLLSLRIVLPSLQVVLPSLRAKRSNPAIKLYYTLAILIFTVTPACARTLNLAKRKISDVSKLRVKEGVTKLRLQKNKIAEVTPLRLPSTLKSLNIAKNQISDLNKLQLNSGLEVLTAFSNRITTVNGFVLPEGLQYLSLSINDINDPKTLQLPNSLEELRFLSCNISDEAIRGLVLSENLDSLELAFNNLTSLEGIQFNDKITELSLNANAFTEMNWNSLPHTITNFDFGSNRDVTNFDEMTLPPNLKIFSLGVIFFDNPSFMNGKLPETLTSLALRRNFIDSLEGFEVPPNLEKLDLEHNSLTSFDYELPESMLVLDLRDNPIGKKERRRIRARYKHIPKLKIKF